MYRAVIDATGYNPYLSALLQRRNTPLLSVGGKPIIFHLLDLLLALKIKECHLLLHHLPHLIEESLGDGSRWGMSIFYHLCQQADHPFHQVYALSTHWDREKILLARADSIPQVNFSPSLLNSDSSYFWNYSHHHWSGWGILAASLLTAINRNLTTKEFPFQQRKEAHFLYTKPIIDSSSLHDLLKSNLSFLKSPPADFHFPASARMIREGVWISRGATIAPSATLIPPLFIGENSQIKDSCTIGPAVVIESDCLIDAESQIDHTLIMRNSYVGTALHIQNSIIDRHLLLNLSLKSEVAIRDDFILSHLHTEKKSSVIVNVLERCLAALLLLLLSPLFLAMCFSHQLHSTAMLLLPAKHTPQEWKTFELYDFVPKPNRPYISWKRHLIHLPRLTNIVFGQLHFVGVVPRTILEAKQLPKTWLELYLNAKSGMITLTEVNDDPTPSEEERFSSEAYYAVTMGFWNDLKIIWRWITLALKQVFHA